MSYIKKLLHILLPEQRRKLPFILGLMAVAMVFEMLGVGLVVPLLAVLVQPEMLYSNPWAGSLLKSFGEPDQRMMLLGGLLIIVGTYFLKAVFLTYQSAQQAKFIYGVQQSLSQRLFSIYLTQPYTFHLERNSAQLIRSALTDVAQFTGKCLLPGMLLCTELISFLGIMAMLFLADPVATTVVLLAIGVLAGSFFAKTRTRILRWGREKLYHDGQRIQHLQQGLNGAKDVKLLGREEVFITRYDEHSRAVERVSRREALMQQMPRFWIEFFAVIGVVILVVIMVAQSPTISGVVPLLGLFGAATFRLMPSANRMITAFQAVRFGVAVMESLYVELDLKPEVSASTTSSIEVIRHSIELEDIGFRYENAPNDALNHISLEVFKGETIGFTGPSGSGKSTLVDLILGLLPPSRGRVLVDGKNISGCLRAWQNQIGYVQQSIYLTDDTLRRNIAFGLRDEEIDEDAMWRAVRSAQLDDFISGLPDGLGTLVGERGVRLSGGQRQRIGIARALYHDPAVLVLDEATSALDHETEKEVMRAVDSLHGKKTILIIAHRLSTLQGCDRVYRLEEGRLLDDAVPNNS